MKITKISKVLAMESYRHKKVPIRVCKTVVGVTPRFHARSSSVIAAARSIETIFAIACQDAAGSLRNAVATSLDHLNEESTRGCVYGLTTS